MKVEKCPRCDIEPLIWRHVIKGTDVILGWEYICNRCNGGYGKRSRTVKRATRKFNRWARRERKEGATK